MAIAQQIHLRETVESSRKNHRLLVLRNFTPDSLECCDVFGDLRLPPGRGSLAGTTAAYKDLPLLRRCDSAAGRRRSANAELWRPCESDVVRGPGTKSGSCGYCIRTPDSPQSPITSQLSPLTSHRPAPAAPPLPYHVPNLRFPV
jgi:hypothetical protein